MRYLSLTEILELHRRIIAGSGGDPAIRDLGRLEAAVAQPKMTFDGRDLYASELEKIAALGFALVMNHPFMDGNKRVSHAAMEVMLLLNGFALTASVSEAERLMLGLAAGEITRDALLAWLRTNARRPQAAQ